MPTLRTVAICGLVILWRLAGQNAPTSAGPKDEAHGTPAVLACPSANQPVEDRITFSWKPGSGTVSYRLLLGPTPGANRDGDTAIITGLQAQFAGLPAAQSLYVTLWSYDSSGKAVDPPSFCFIKTTPGNRANVYKDLPQTSLTGVSLGSVALKNGAAEPALACQQQCSLNAACLGYTYFPPNGNSAAVCDLKSQITATYHNECCVSALKGGTPGTPPGAPAADTLAPVAASPVVTGPTVPPPSAAPLPAAPLPAAPAADPFATRSAPTLTPQAVAVAPVQTPPANAPAPSSTGPTPPAAPAPAAPRAPSPPAPKTVARTAGLSGDWVNQFGAISRLVQQGAAISGVYSDTSQPSLSGALEGTFDGKTLRATLTWKSGADSSHGTLLLTLTSDGRLDGTWTDANGVSGPWNMARKQ